MSDNQIATHSHDGLGAHTHSVADEHTHSHTHDAEDIVKIVNRMSKIIGHMKSVRDMVEEGRDCAEVITQLAAVKSALNGVGKLLIKEHMEHCLVEAIEENDVSAVKELNDAIDRFL